MSDKHYPWVMVDLETTGTHPEHSAIIQIAGVRFNPFDLSIDATSMFSRCLLVPQHRYWSEDTRGWWTEQNEETLASIFRRMEDPYTVLKEFSDWAFGSAVLVAKPLSFEYPFLSSYFRDYEVANPFPFWMARDLRSIMQGLTWPHPFNEKSVPFEGPEHDALFDCLHQIKLLFKAVEVSRSPRMENEDGD